MKTAADTKKERKEKKKESKSQFRKKEIKLALNSPRKIDPCDQYVVLLSSLFQKKNYVRHLPLCYVFMRKNLVKAVYYIVTRWFWQ